MKNRNRYITVILVIAIFVVVIGYIYTIKNKSNDFVPDYASGTIDVNAIKEEGGKKTPAKKGSGSVNLKFSNVVAVDKKSKTAKLYFKNPNTSNKNVILFLIIRQNSEELVLGKTDLIPSGYAVYNMKLDNIDNLPVGGYKGILKTVFYDDTSNAKEIIDSEIEVSIEVKQ